MSTVLVDRWRIWVEMAWGVAISSGKAPGFTGYFNGPYKVLLQPYWSESILSLFLIIVRVNGPVIPGLILQWRCDAASLLF